MYMYHARCHAVADGQTKRLRRDEGLQVSHTKRDGATRRGIGMALAGLTGMAHRIDRHRYR